MTHGQTATFSTWQTCNHIDVDSYATIADFTATLFLPFCKPLEKEAVQDLNHPNRSYEIR